MRTVPARNTKKLSSQSKGKKDKIMTAKERAMYNDLVISVKTMTKRIEKLEQKLSESSVSVRSKTASPKTEKTVGNLVFFGKYVKTGSGYMSSKTRYAVGMAITERFGGVKLAKGNKVFDKAHKEDKYVQVYEFPTVEDCEKFMEDQQSRSK